MFKTATSRLAVVFSALLLALVAGLTMAGMSEDERGFWASLGYALMVVGIAVGSAAVLMAAAVWITNGDQNEEE